VLLRVLCCSEADGGGSSGEGEGRRAHDKTERPGDGRC